MQWLELQIDPPDKNADAVAAELEALGISGLVIEDESDFLAFLETNRAAWDYVDEELRAAMKDLCRVTFYLEDTPKDQARLGTLRETLPWPISARTIKEEDWANNWKKYYRPIPIGDKLLVVPEWETVESGGRIELRLDPGLIFGTGAHPTTKLCLEAVENLAKPGQAVLDLGCGSGILSIAALLLGADQAIACDLDPKAPDVVRANAALNGIDDTRLIALRGDVLAAGTLRRQLGEAQYDLILANIVADVIIGLSAFTAPWLKAEGRLVCSGIIDGREQEVEQALQSGGFIILERHRELDWHSFICTVDESGHLR